MLMASMNDEDIYLLQSQTVDVWSVLQGFYQDGFLCDVIIRASYINDEGETDQSDFSVHSCIAAVFSRAILASLQNTCTSEKNKLIFEVQQVPAKSLHYCIDFMYGQRIPVTTKNYLDVKRAATVLDIEDLLDSINELPYGGEQDLTVKVPNPETVDSIVNSEVEGPSTQSTIHAKPNKQCIHGGQDQAELLEAGEHSAHSALHQDVVEIECLDLDVTRETGLESLTTCAPEDPGIDKPSFSDYSNSGQGYFQGLLSPSDPKSTRDQLQSESKAYACQHCDLEFKSKRQLQIHIRREVKGKTNVCEICGRVCRCASELKTHMTRHLPQQERPRKCSLCNYRCISKTELRNHMLVHEEAFQQPYMCTFCNHFFRREKSMRDHMKKCSKRTVSAEEEQTSSHQGQEASKASKEKKTYKRSLLCKHCDQVFPSNRMLWLHRKVEIHGRVDICQICGKHFSHRSALEEHISRHLPTSQRPFPCKKCSYRGVSKTELKRHMSAHSSDELRDGNEDLTCSHCGWKCKSTRSLKHHITAVHK